MRRFHAALAGLAALIASAGEPAAGAAYLPNVHVQPTGRPTEQPAPALLTVTSATARAGAPLHFMVHFDDIDDGTQPIVVVYRTLAGSAVAGTNYIATAGRLTLAPFSTQSVIVQTLVAPPGDAVRTLELAVAFRGYAASGQGTIVPSSVPLPPVALPIFHLGAARAIAGKPLVFVLRDLDPPGALPIRWRFATADGTAIAGRHYAATAGSIMLAPQSQRPILVYTEPAPSGDPARTMTLTMTNGPVTASSAGTIDPPAPSSANDISITPVRLTVGGGDTIVARVLRGGPALPRQRVRYTVADPSNCAETPFVAGEIAFAPGQTTAPLTYRTCQNQPAQGPHIVTISLQKPRRATLGNASLTATVNDGPSGILKLLIDATRKIPAIALGLVIALAAAFVWAMRALVRRWRLRHGWPWPLTVTATCRLDPPAAAHTLGPVRVTGPEFAVSVTLTVAAPACFPPRN